MKWVRNDDNQRIPIKSWCDPIEDNALAQAVNLSRHPAAVKHVALMPDCHLGNGMPIGGVIACKDAVIPNAVGVDIGCGMAAVKTDLPAEAITTDQIKAVMGKIRKAIPVGFKHHGMPQPWDRWMHAPEIPIVQKEIQRAKRQLGTLGGGNHFVEIQAGDDGAVWLMIHSGSRNFGKKIADAYHQKARILCRQWYADLPSQDLAFLPAGTSEAKEYIGAMSYALDFASENRRLIMERAKACLNEAIECGFEAEVNIHHNYAALENHFGRNLWVHRKGATAARVGQKGIIPGSMGTPSYIVEGLGNPESFMSCSHGAGRVMGRNQASRTLSQVVCDKAMQGIVFGRWSKNRQGRLDFGEAPQAYKDIDSVIDAQMDLINPLVKLNPLGVIKG
jgi:tRNA-splicing ligase RtcB (3'-phosphate/5'-hydroxy nucleic acid ligase)